MNFLPLIFVMCSAITVKSATNSWFSPGSLFSILAILFLSLPMIFASEFNINNYGIWYITILVMSFASGSVCSTFTYRSEFNIKRNVKADFSSLIIPLVIFNLISLSGLILLIFYLKSNYLNLNFNSEWFLIPNFISIDRYGGFLSYPLVIKYSLYFIYPGNIISAILLCNKNKGLALILICLLPMIFSISLGFIEGSRTSILLGGTLFLSSWISTRTSINDGKLNISFYKIFIFMLLSILSFIILFSVIQWLRQGLDPLIFNLLVERIKVYFFGYLSAFTLWFSEVNNPFLPTSLLNTFAGPMNLLGLIERNLGFYIPLFINDETSTNIFTAYRSLVSDYSIFGSVLIFFIIGYFIQSEFQKIKKNIFDGIIPISVFYSFIIYSPLISVFHYNSIFFSWAIIYFIIKIIDK